MGKSNGDPVKLEFKLEDKQRGWKKPTWVPVTTENSECPQCGGLMTVVLGELLYAHCQGCGQYFIGK